MIDHLRIFCATGTDPYTNLATEKVLMDATPATSCTLYLWQNQNTVVIGHNQNAWAECRTTLLQQEGGKLARRLSGGGAVFHDLGNLNFTFLMAKDNYDLDKQLSVIIRACASAGVTAERSGRNDLLTQGQKFSGNAFYHNKTHAYHHGTLLIHADMDKLSRYLSPSKAKLQSKGVASVRSRVVNLKELAPALTVDRMKSYMQQAFEEVYGLPADPVSFSKQQQQEICTLAQEYGSWEYLYGTSLPFSFRCEGRYPWGGIHIALDAKNGSVSSAKVYSDSMDWALPSAIEEALTGCRFELAAMQTALRAVINDPEVANDLCTLLSQQQL